MILYTIPEFFAAWVGYREENIEAWRRARWIGYFSAIEFLEKGVKPKDLLPLPGDEVDIEKIDIEAEKKKLEENKDWFTKIPE